MAYINETRTATASGENAYTFDHTTARGLTVGPDAILRSQNGFGLGGEVYGFSVLVSGYVSGRRAAISLTQPEGDEEGMPSGSRLIIHERGYVDGEIFLNATGSTLENYGTVTDSISFSGNSLHQLVNYGVITTRNDAVINGAEGFILRNHGIISGQYSSFNGSWRRDEVINTGTMNGGVYLDGGDDRMDNRKGTVIGMIHGGDGNDTFLPGDGEETIEGGEGRDQIEFRGSTPITVDLGLSERNSGRAEGDSYSGIEEVLGTALANDRLYGSWFDDRLNGRGGDDRLEGRAGRDVLIGGEGADTLRGGSGSDRFVYQSSSEFGDKIIDFTNARGNDDRFEFVNVRFMGTRDTGTIDSTAFRSGKTNAARDADDRFIFRTTDKTLWFDADGNGRAKAMMVADLNDDASLSHKDIVLTYFDTIF